VSHSIGVTHSPTKPTKQTKPKHSNMPVSELLKSPFVPNNHYHLVFKSIDGILLFRNKTDYPVFLERFQRFTGFIFDIWAYCQLSNHVHFIGKSKPLEKVTAGINELDLDKQTVAMKKLLATPDKPEAFDEMIERQVNSFMVSFANFTKNKYSHHGGLFQKPFKRIKIETDAHLQQAIIYVHANSVKHKVFDDYTTYPYCSYPAFIKTGSNYCTTEDVLNFFGGLDKFIQLHEEQVENYYRKDFPNSKLE
jgi:putative transposase